MIEQSNEQIKQMQEIMQSNSITSDTFSKKREEDQEFFWQVMVTMSQTMMRVTQMLMQGAAPGNHPPNQAYTPPNYSFSSSGMGYGFTLHQLDHQAQLQAKQYPNIMICQTCGNMKVKCETWLLQLNLTRDQSWPVLIQIL